MSKKNISLHKQFLHTFWDSINGYFVNSAKIEYIVAWHEKGEEEDIAVILPELRLQKRVICS